MTLPPKLQETIEEMAKQHAGPLPKAAPINEYSARTLWSSERNSFSRGAYSLYSILEPVLREVEEALEWYAEPGNTDCPYECPPVPEKANKALTRLRETIGPIQKQGE